MDAGRKKNRIEKGRHKIALVPFLHSCSDRRFERFSLGASMKGVVHRLHVVIRLERLDELEHLLRLILG